MIVTSVQIKTAKTQKHLYCLVFTKIGKHKKCLPILLFTVHFSRRRASLKMEVGLVKASRRDCRPCKGRWVAVRQLGGISLKNRF